jgi:hypothetical protein
MLFPFQNSIPGVLTDFNGNEIVFSAADSDVFAPFRTVYYEFSDNPIDPEIQTFFEIDNKTGKLMLKAAFNESSPTSFSVRRKF